MHEYKLPASHSEIKLGPWRIFETRILCLRPGLYSKICRNSVSHKAIILHLINNLTISSLTARAAHRAAGRAEEFLAGQMPCHALPWRRHWLCLVQLYIMLSQC